MLLVHPFNCSFDKSRELRSGDVSIVQSVALLCSYLQGCSGGDADEMVIAERLGNGQGSRRNSWNFLKICTVLETDKIKGFFISVFLTLCISLYHISYLRCNILQCFSCYISAFVIDSTSVFHTI
jgi:hypothetical protein